MKITNAVIGTLMAAGFFFCFSADAFGRGRSRETRSTGERDSRRDESSAFSGFDLFGRGEAALQEERNRREMEEKARREEANRDTRLTLAVDAIRDFSVEFPARKVELLKMCEDFYMTYVIGNYQPATLKEEKAMNIFDSFFLKADEAMIQDARNEELYELRDVIERRVEEARRQQKKAEEAERARQAALERERELREQEEENRKMSSVRAKELSENLAAEKDRYAGRMVVLTMNGRLERAEEEYNDWLKMLELLVQDWDETVANVARPYYDWAQLALDNIAGAKAIRENTYNGNTILEGTQVGYGPTGICTVKSIKNGVVKAAMVDKKLFQFNFDDLPLKQRLVLLKKGAYDAGYSESLYFYLLLYGDFDGADIIADGDETSLSVIRYVKTCFFEYEISKANADDLTELKKKYGGMPEFKEAMKALNK